MSDGSDQNHGLFITFYMGFRLAASALYAIIFIYINEVFPTQVRVPGFGMITFVGGVSIVFIPQLTNLAISHNVSIMVFFTVLSIICVLIFFIMP